MNQIIRNGLQSLILSEGCQSLSNQANTAWIFSFIEQHHAQPNELRDMWLFTDQEGKEAAISIWCIPPEGVDQAKHWEMKGSRLKEKEVLLFVKNSICYTLPEYFELEFGEEQTHLREPDIIFPGD